MTKMLVASIPVVILFLGCTEDRERPGSDPTDSFVWFDTGEITHDRDYHDFRPYLNPEAPVNWWTPVNWSNAAFTLTVEITEMFDPSALPIYYTVGWKPGDPGKSGYVRVAIRIDDGPGVYTQTGLIRNAQKVVDGVDGGAVGDDWDWTNAWREPRGDAWDGNPDAVLYPFSAKVKMVLHPVGETPEM